ncbi:hypothetical protein AFERRI_270004 [Acidithiobacillus ferrivorans]|uniref:Uncharacterized protein n=1 Tax=Acidithiobacillus ferrivorans TaxID=160808 RepID=A0A060UR93_9PROT|nr:hypothetical protein AFERRI_270004 [Acidithiobacillus ferrivorans]
MLLPLADVPTVKMINGEGFSFNDMVTWRASFVSMAAQSA